jgi:branched-chain amino acid transport system permease protein
MRAWLARLAVLAVAVVAVAAVPRFVSDFHAFQLATVAIYFVALLGLNILTGYSGQISLGHGAFMAIGGYTSAILMVHHHVRDLWTIPLAGLVAGIAGLLFGLPALRLSGLYLALVTFGIAVSFPQVLKKAEHFHPDVLGLHPNLSTAGTTGLILNLPTPPFGIHTTPNRWLYYLCWGIALALLVGAWALLGGRTGRALRAVRDSEVAATSSGVRLATYKTLAFGVSAFYAGVAGSLLAISVAYVSPETYPITLSIVLVVGAAVGGLGSLGGLLVGAAFIQYLGSIAAWLLGRIGAATPLDLDPKKPGVPSVIYGVALILVMLLLPGGVGGLLRRAGAALTSRGPGES